ncbi:MAG TPA: LPXTG cell wall anchor domain-containing protein [Nocardioidaceae bacterium]|nr:LPXTG cell wall anchor domain-containing protein [Nocardioidaceae bacterium]
MQIKQTGRRAAAALTVTMFLAAGAMAPAQATEESGAQTEDRAAHGTQTSEERRADQSYRSDESLDDETSSDDIDGGTPTEDEVEESQQESSDDQGGDDADETQAGPGKNGAGTTCNKLGYTKIDQPSGSAELEFGTLEWGGDTLSYVVHDGFTVDLCIKSGVKAPITTFVVVGAAEGSKQIAQDISHIGYLLTEEDAESEGPAVEAEPEETVVAPEEDGSCPEGATMNAGECVVPPIEMVDEVAGVEMDVTDEVADVEAEMAPASGVLPATGAGEYAWVLLAGLGLLGAGGVLLARRRPRLDG